MRTLPKSLCSLSEVNNLSSKSLGFLDTSSKADQDETLKSLLIPVTAPSPVDGKFKPVDDGGISEIDEGNGEHHSHTAPDTDDSESSKESLGIKDPARTT